jgi:alpha-glucosidase
MRPTLSIIILCATCVSAAAQKNKSFELTSPNNKIKITVSAGSKLEWSLTHNNEIIVAPSSISLQLENENAGNNATIISSPTTKVNRTFSPINYHKKTIKDEYNQLTLNCKGNYGIIFRAYNDAVAYRFFTKMNGEIIIRSEEANFNFPEDEEAFYPIQWDYRDGKNFNSSFEALYRETKLSAFPKDSLAFLPLLVEVDEQTKVAILEADLEDYPGMYVHPNENKGLQGVFAPYPLDAEVKERNLIPTKRADYIAKTTGTRSFPWRVVVISETDKELLDQDIVQKLASSPRIADVSWVQPGQVAWDWWNNWNVTHVDFKAGINTATYKYYIDFAAANKVKYIVMDEGWSDRNDLMSIVPDISLQEIVDYGKQKNVDVILWATWYRVSQQMKEAFPYYAKMGVKGFKIDFFDRDDQLVVASTYEIAKFAADNKLVVDYHGIYKPTGLQRTYPNVIGYEGVKGLENYKWANEDQPRYAVSIPFIRMLAGPMDYTPGAMRNATKSTFFPNNDNPMSKGTRCHQLAMYVIYDAPLQMLSDNPTIYMKEKESKDFIIQIPTTFDETVPLDGKVAEYVALARKKDDTWFAAAMTNWEARDLTLDLAFLPAGAYEAEIFSDGVNADRDATDYKKQIKKITSGEKLNIHLAPGGGWAARIYPVK